MKSELTENDISSFHELGFISFDKAIESDELKQLTEYCHSLMTQRGVSSEQKSEDESQLVWIRSAKDECEGFKKFNVFKNALRWASQLLDIPENKIVYRMRVFYKPPMCSSVVPWHQDEAFYQAYMKNIPEGYAFNSINFWLSLNDATEKSGTLKYIPKSHKGGLREHKAEVSGHNETLKDDEEANEDQDGKVLYSEDLSGEAPYIAQVSAGGINLHHCRTMHSSDGNGSDAPRGAFVLIFQEPLPTDDTASEVN